MSPSSLIEPHGLFPLEAEIYFRDDHPRELVLGRPTADPQTGVAAKAS
jgi:hypothetical protein